MSRFKKIIIGIVIFFGVVYVGTLFLKKDYAVSRQIVINRPLGEVFDHVKLLENQSTFMNWLKIDSLNQVTKNGTDGSVGFTIYWDSESFGKGQKQISSIKPKKEVNFTVTFEEPIFSESYITMTTDSLSEQQTKLNSHIKGHIPYPANVMMLFMNIEQSVGSEIQRSLDSIKIAIERVHK